MPRNSEKRGNPEPATGLEPATARYNAAFAATGLATVATYAGLWLEPLWLGDFDPFGAPALSLTSILGPDWHGLARFCAALALPFALYLAGLWLAPRADRRTAGLVAGLVAVAAPAMLLAAYPALAADLFDYLMSGRILVEYGRNPFLVAASRFPDDAFYPPVGFPDEPSVYGPAWVTVSAVAVKVFPGSPLSALLLLKAVAVIAHAGTAWLVYRLAARLHPGHEISAVVAYAWNPLAVLAVGIDGHNDGLMMLCLTAAVYLALDRRWDLAIPVLVLGGLVKYIPFALLPYFVFAGRTQPRLVLTGLAAGAFLSLVAFGVFWAGPDTLDPVRHQAAKLTSSPAALASFYIPDSTLRPAALVLFAAAYLLVLRRARSVVEAAFWLLLAFLFTMTFWAKSWYLLWLAPLGAALGGRYLAATAAASFGAMASTVFGGWGWQMNWFQWQQRWGMQPMEWALTLSTYGGWLLAGLVVLLRDRWRVPSGMPPEGRRRGHSRP